MFIAFSYLHYPYVLISELHERKEDFFILPRAILAETMSRGTRDVAPPTYSAETGDFMRFSYISAL
jgi:hypothetical protein